MRIAAPKYSFFAFLWEYFLDDSDREALLQVIRLKYTEQWIKLIDRLQPSL